MKRRQAGLILASVALALLSSCVPAKSAPSVKTHAVSEETRRARAFDEQGVIAFESGRYHDALAYFDAAFAHGGPPSERWNQAKCYLRLDEPEQAESALVSYLALAGLTADDKREGEATLAALRHRASPVTVTSSPLGLEVSVAGKALGPTPITFWLAAGDHVVVVHRAHAPDARDEHAITAHLGRAVIVESRP